MRKFATAIAVTLLGASLALAAPQEAANGGGHRGRQMMTFTERFGATLNLTDAQKTKIDAIQKETREKNAAFFADASATMKAYWDAKQANDTAKLDALKPTMDKYRAQMKELRTAEEAKIAKELTTDQNAQWEKMKAERAAQQGQRQQ
ncbi:MAG TPA: Spy/CpxP family protein refolding chaperone [Thermoanaerobaculia bacterium]|jgi:Spy/CpxP family protein refolding chaperone|nr:Spy/CpxP family protein refolding chaperone [Thermoanaerobaculia bacterium]